MASNRLRRISKELEESETDVHSKVTITTALGMSDLTMLEGRFLGPPDTPYEGGHFVIDIRIPNDYPFRPPMMKFRTKIWHPNVSSQTGAICLDTLSTGWSPVFTLKAALISIQGLLASPEPKDPQDAEVASMLISNPKEFERIARQWAVKYAEAPPKSEPTLSSQSTVKTMSASESKEASESAARKRALYGGYHHEVIDEFAGLGFEVPEVVAAFELHRIPKHVQIRNGLDEEMVDKVTSTLWDV